VSAELPPDCCDDSTSWRHKGEKIDLPRLLELIEGNGGPEELDLHGCNMERIDARPGSLCPYVDAYAQKHGPNAWPPWLSPDDERGINLRGAHLSGAHLEGAILDAARLENAQLHRAYLRGAFLGRAHLEHAEASSARLESAALWLAHLENADLGHAHLESADLRGAHLENAVLDFTHLEDTNFVWSRLHGAFWREAYLDRTRMRRESLGQAIGDELGAKGRAARSSSFHHAREAYLLLKTNFDSIGRYDDASWAYVKEQQMEKAMYFPTTPGHRWIRRSVRQRHRRWLNGNPRHRRRLIRANTLGRLHRFLRTSILACLQWGWLHVLLFLGRCPREVKQKMARRDEHGNERDEWFSSWRWARNWSYELLTGHGERPQIPVMWAVVVVVLFALTYAGAGNIASGEGGGTHNFLTALTHSIAAFATVGFNTLEPVGWGARLLTAVEAMFGIGLFALFVFTLGNRMRRS
jgi:uncharacterized protein YjbI with pentapeptide repeats